MSTESRRWFGPAEANKALDTARDENGHFINRRIEDRRVALYMDRMTTPGGYDEKIPTISFDTSGKLCGGFHTLLAVSRSGTSWEFRVLEDVPDEMIAALNENRQGTVADELRRRGRSSFQDRAAAATVLMRFDRGTFTMRGQKEYAVVTVADRADREEYMDEGMHWGNRLYQSPLQVLRAIGTVSFITLAHYLNENSTRELFETVLTGLNLRPDEPATALRACLEREAAAARRVKRGGRVEGYPANRALYAFIDAGRRLYMGTPARRISPPKETSPADIRRLVWWEPPAEGR